MNSDQVFFDTGYIIGLLNRTDPHHETARRWSAELRALRHPHVTTTAVLIELGDGFAQKGRWDLIHPFLEAAAVDSLVEIVEVGAELVARAVRLKRDRPDKDWGLTDCTSFLIMWDRGITEALAADRHFVQAGFRALLLEPTTRAQ